jgi:hypothetical protein
MPLQMLNNHNYLPAIHHDPTLAQNYQFDVMQVQDTLVVLPRPSRMVNTIRRLSEDLQKRRAEST